ncbi:hypothetical protein [Vulcanisaeta sp. JCM 14467]|nr:hypothetical protein [Vulcanisaeta sp. JCM 14467]
MARVTRTEPDLGPWWAIWGAGPGKGLGNSTTGNNGCGGGNGDHGIH